MADSINIPVNVDVKVDKQQLNNVSSQIEKSVNKIKGFKTKDFFAPITNSAKSLQKGLIGLQNGVNSLSNSFSSLKKIAMNALSLTALIKTGKEMIKLSSDLIEIQNVVDTVFGDMADSINEFSKSALKSFGLTELQAKNFVSVFGGMLEASDIVGDAQKEMAINLTKLTGDVASFYNMDYDTVFNKLQSGLTGEVMAMRSFGVNMTIANLEAWALANGITKSYDAMSQAEKTALRYNYMLEKLSNAQGDFNKTQGSWANQNRILVSQVKQLGAILGGFLQKILYPVLTVINQIIGMAISGASALAKMFGFDMESIQISQGLPGGAGIDIEDTGADAMEDLADSTDDATEAQKKLNKEQNKSLANIHSLNVLQSKSSSSGTSGVSGLGGVGDIGFDLSKYKDIEQIDKDNPVKNFFNSIKKAVEESNWRGIGSLLSDKVNELFDNIHLDKYIDNFREFSHNFAEILNGLVQNLHFDEIGRVLAEGLNLIIVTVNEFFKTFDFIALGQQLASGLNSFINTIDWEELGVFLINKFNALFQLITGFVTEFDWVNLGLKISTALNSIFKNIDFASVSIAIYGFINGIFETIGTTIINTDWNKLSSDFANAFTSIFSNIDYGLILSTIILAFTNIVSLIATFISEVDWSSIGESISNGINTALNLLADIDLEGILNNLSQGFINLFNSLVEVIQNIDWMQLGNIIYDAILSIDWAGLILSIGNLILNALGALSTLVVTLIVRLIADIVGVLWGIAGYISNMLTAIGALVLNFLGNLIGSVIANITAIIELVGALLTVLFSNLSEWFSSVIESASTWFSNLITNITGFLSDTWSSISEFFSNVWNGFTGFLGDILSYITGVFKSAWNSAWNGLKDVFTSLADTIGGIFKGVINTVVDDINTIINAINNISWDVPDWVPGIGGSTFGFSIPNVPKLAKGAVIPPNQEFLAVLGDQKSGMNIETPLETMIQAFKLALSDFSDYNGVGDIVIPIYVNSELSSEEIIRRQDIERYRSNGK